jgi:hypothetical protein
VSEPAIPFSTVVAVDADADALCRLAVDLERYTAVEPTLAHAAWLEGGPPRSGSRALVEGEIPFSVPLVRRVVGPPHGTATLERFEPPRVVEYSLSTRRADGVLTARFEQRDDATVVRAAGWIDPHSASARRLLRGLRGPLGQLAANAIRRGVLRAAAGLKAPAR